MEAPAKTKPAGRRWLKGCVTWLLAAMALMAWAVWQIGEPNRRARETLAWIQPGMNALEIEPKITGRHYSAYQLRRDNEWEIIPREEFQRLTTTPSAGAPAQFRLMLTFLGMASGRATFVVEIGPDGRVQKVNQPYNWD